MDHRYFLALATSLALMAGTIVALASANPVLQVRARVGPWPVISRLIEYNGRIWFANSVKWRNHNSADIWSLDPATGNLRYERNLFSQDAGHPLVHRGLLYWPFEDARFSFGWGMVEVTDGHNWQPLVVPTAQIFHTNSMIDWQDRLLAVTSAWRTGLQVSDNLGRDWTQLYDHPTPKGRLSRLHELLVMHNEIYGWLEDPAGVRLVKFVNNRPRPVPGWPKSRRLFALTLHKRQIFAVVQAGGGYQIWRSNDSTSEQTGTQLTQVRVVDMASDGLQLWAISYDGKTGQLWSSPQGVVWHKRTRFSGGRPLSLNIIAGKIYVAGAGDDHRGIMWGPPAHDIAQPHAPAELPVQFLPTSSKKNDWQSMGARLDAALGDLTQYQGQGRGNLRELIFDAVKRGPPPGFFAQRLSVLSLHGTVKTFGGKLDVSVTDLGQSIVLWGMGLSRQKDVPIATLKRTWTAPANSFEKYFDPQLTALWAVAISGQKDAVTLHALMERLDAKSDPLWLRAQVIGTLSALTGKRFAYDIEKWHRWWTSARTTWGK